MARSPIILRQFLDSLLVLLLFGCAIKPAPNKDETLAQSLPETTEIPEQFSVNADPGAVDDGWLDSFNAPQLKPFLSIPHAAIVGQLVLLREK